MPGLDGCGASSKLLGLLQGCDDFDAVAFSLNALRFQSDLTFIHGEVS